MLCVAVGRNGFILKSSYLDFIKGAGFFHGVVSFLPLAFNVVQKTIERTHNQGVVDVCAALGSRAKIWFYIRPWHRPKAFPISTYLPRTI